MSVGKRAKKLGQEQSEKINPVLDERRKAKKTMENERN
jgi:hypothetical protein